MSKHSESNSNFPLLGVNIDHVATLRQARGTKYPSVIDAAKEVISGGASQITVHLREDRRHIQDRDVYDLKKVIDVPLNLEMATADEIVNIAIDVKPTVATLVPEKREELTTEGGLDCLVNQSKLRDVIKRLHDVDIKVSLFIDPDNRQIEMSKELGADSVELHTGRYCEEESSEELELLLTAARYAEDADLRVCAGHGLNVKNIGEVVKNIPEIVEYNIGHALISDALFVGLENSTRRMLDLIRQNFS